MVLNLSDLARNHLPLMALMLLVVSGGVAVASRTAKGRGMLDVLKLRTPVLGEVFRKVAVARLARTLGTLLGSGVPVLQALSIARETAGNAVVARVVAEIHLHVKQGDPVAPTLRASRVFPAIVAGMVDVGEQTGALPEMFSKIADIYDDEVDSAVAAMTSLLEPVMIVLLAVIVGSIVIALFLPIITVGNSI
jgi:type IV pilus assembly protein PilC